MITLRQYQLLALGGLNMELLLGLRPLLVAPTGSGKTPIAAALIHQDLSPRVLFLAHRRELIHQAKLRLIEAGVDIDDIGVMLAGENPDEMARVQVGTIQTVWARRKNLPPADIVIIDEAHHVRARTYEQIIACYPEAQLMGMTATPVRSDGRGLGNKFDVLVEVPQVQELIDLGWLVPTVTYAPNTPELRGVRVRMGDYIEADLAKRVDQPKLVGDIVTHWHRLAQGRKTVVFASGVQHSLHIKEEFCKSGVKAGHIDGKTPKLERDAILKALSDGDIEVVSNCMVLTEGWDQPDVACIVLARPTKSMGLYRQMVGRGLRPYEGKDHLLVLDHAGAIFEHGHVEDPVAWSLDENSRAASLTHSRREKIGKGLCACSSCGAVRTAGSPCPACGFLPRRPAKDVAVMNGDLARIERNGKMTPHTYTLDEKRDFHGMMIYIAEKRGYKSGWVGHKFRERFGYWPQDRNVEPMEPSREVLNWIKRGQIEYAKKMQKEQT